MERFHPDGHLTDEALRELIAMDTDELGRLELAEHLAYCDKCLLRYTHLLENTALMEPPHSCRNGLWQRIRLRAVRVLTSRYATAAAALVILFSLWNFNVFDGIVERSRVLTEPEAVFTREILEPPADHSNPLDGLFDHLGSAFDRLTGGNILHGRDQ